MNCINVSVCINENVYDNFPNIKIDEFLLNEELERLYPSKGYGNLIPTLLFGMETHEEELVWNRINPSLGMRTICPILMSPNSYDFTNILIVAEIEKTTNTIYWNKIGVVETADCTQYNVNWFEEMPVFQFKNSHYQHLLKEFKRHYEVDKILWKGRMSWVEMVLQLEEF